MSGQPDDDDTSAFAEAMRGVQRAAGAVHITPDGRRLSTRPRQRELDDREVMRELLMDLEPDRWESGDTLLYRADGVQDGVMRKLRRGQYRIQGELDLHGLNRDRARVEVARFLTLCEDRDARCVRIVHGKGLGSPNSGPVLKNHLSAWLRRQRSVLAYCSARPVDGGTGAIYVLLRGRPAGT